MKGKRLFIWAQKRHQSYREYLLLQFHDGVANERLRALNRTPRKSMENSERRKAPIIY